MQRFKKAEFGQSVLNFTLNKQLNIQKSFSWTVSFCENCFGFLESLPCFSIINQFLCSINCFCIFGCLIDTCRYVV